MLSMKGLAKHFFPFAHFDVLVVLSDVVGKERVIGRDSLVEETWEM